MILAQPHLEFNIIVTGRQHIAGRILAIPYNGGFCRGRRGSRQQPVPRAKHAIFVGVHGDGIGAVHIGTEFECATVVHAWGGTRRDETASFSTFKAKVCDVRGQGGRSGDLCGIAEIDGVQGSGRSRAICAVSRVWWVQADGIGNDLVALTGKAVEIQFPDVFGGGPPTRDPYEIIGVGSPVCGEGVVAVESPGIGPNAATVGAWIRIGGHIWCDRDVKTFEMMFIGRSVENPDLIGSCCSGQVLVCIGDKSIHGRVT